MTPSTKRIILVRHAHREIVDRTEDNGLSEKGWEQAQIFTDWFLNHDDLTQIALLSSPKLRCIETLEFLSRKLKQTIQIEKGLDECHSAENQKDFVQRVKKFVSALKTRPETRLVLCSHGDWIPVAGDLLSGQNIDLGKGKWIELTLNP